MPKEKPILFSGPMVRAILDGRKTQTRRVVKPQPIHDIVQCEGGIGFYEQTPNPSSSGYPVFGSPFGQPGGRLWVRETWAHERQFDHLAPSDFPDSACTSDRCLYRGDIVHRRLASNLRLQSSNLCILWYN